MRSEFESIRDGLNKTHVETEDEGRERAKNPSSTGIAELEENYYIVRFVSRDHSELAKHNLRLAIDLLPTLQTMFDEEEATVPFLSAWGTFNELVSVPTSSRALMEDGLDPARRANAAANTKASSAGIKRRFVARLLAEKRRARKGGINACRAAAQDISKFVKLNSHLTIEGKEFGKDWFGDLLIDPKSVSPELRPTYDRGHLTGPEIVELTDTPDPILDSIEIFFHNTVGSVPKT